MSKKVLTNTGVGISLDCIADQLADHFFNSKNNLEKFDSSTSLRTRLES